MEAEPVQQQLSETWWNRPCGGWDVLCQAVPLIISCGSISLMNFTDRAFLMAWNLDAMTASMQGGMLFWSSVAIPTGIAVFATTFVSQYVGSGNFRRVGPVVWQGIWLGMLTLPVMLLLSPWLTEIFSLFNHEHNLIELEKTYYNILVWGVSASVGGEAAAAFFRGQGKMQVEMYVNLFCVALNVVLDYVMIFGKFGFPEMGLVGAAWATMISQWARFGLYILLMFWTDIQTHRFNVLGGMVPDWRLMGRLLYFGTPSSSYHFVDTVTFALFIIIIGGLGSVQAAATTIAFTMNALSFIPLVGIGIVVTSMVGNQLGDNRPDLARRATNTAAVMGLVYTGALGILFLAIPHVLLSPFEAYTDGAEFAEVYEVSIVLMRFIAFYLLFDCLSIVFSSALRGAGDTVFIMLVVLISAPLLPLCCFVGIRYFDLGVIWCWIALTGSVFAYCGCFTPRYFGGKWESMRVIEKNLQKHEIA